MSLKSLVGRFKGRLVLVAGISFGAAINEALFIVLLTSLAGSLLGTGGLGAEFLGIRLDGKGSVLAACFLLILRLLLGVASVWMAARLAERLTYTTRSKLVESYLGASWSIQQREPSGRLQELLTTFVDRVNTAMTGVTMTVTAICSIVAFLGAGVVVDPFATVGAIAVLALLALLLFPVRRLLRRSARVLAETGVRFAEAVAETISLSLEMRVFGVVDRFARRLDDRSVENSAAKRRVQVLTAVLPQLYISLAYAAVLAGLGFVSLVGASSIAGLGAVMLLMLRSLSYAQQLMSGISIVTSASPFIERIGAVMDRYTETTPVLEERVPRKELMVQFDEVGFSYENGPAVLRNVSFSVDVGEKIGIIGPSGAGKSTLVQLLMGLRTPTAGVVTLGGEPVSQLSQSWLAGRLGFVPQDAVLMDASVRENVEFMRDIQAEDVADSLRRANLWEVVDQLPEGLDSALGPGGSAMSGGQRQRVAIARALATGPSLLVLDEPTSSLDGDSEAAVRDALAALDRDTTVFIIAHRGATLMHCDRIMVVEDGGVAAFDRPAVLAESSEFFRRGGFGD